MTEERQAEEVLYLTVKEYADMWGIHVQTVYLAIRLKRLPFQISRTARAGIRIRVPRSSMPIRGPVEGAAGVPR